MRCPAGGRSRQEGAGPPLPVVGGNAESGTRGSADAGGDFHGRGSLHKGDVVVTCRSVEHVRHAENAAPDLEWFETAIGKVTFVEDRAGGAAGPAALKDEVVLPVVQERADNAKLRSARDRAADKVLRRRGYGVRPVVVTAEVELQAARERDAVSSVGATDRRPVAGGHPDARCVGGRRRSGRNHLFGGPSGFFPPLRNVPFQGRDFVLQLADSACSASSRALTESCATAGPQARITATAAVAVSRFRIASRNCILVFQWLWNGPSFVLFSHDEFEKAESLR